MGTVMLAARAVIALVFATAAVTKLRDPAAVRATFREFGTGERLASLAPALAFAELAVASGLLIQPAARWAAVAAALLLCIFIGGMSNALRAGRRPDCGCFGGLHPKPIGRSTLVRNALLTALAAVVAEAGPGTSLSHSLPSGSRVAILVGLVAVVTSVLATGSTRRSTQPRVDRVLTPPPSLVPRTLLGHAAPGFDLDGACGPRQTLVSLCADHLPVVLIFGDSGCGSCVSLFARLGPWQMTLSERVRIAVVAFGDQERAKAICTDHHVSDVMLDPGGAVWRAYGVNGSPVAFAISPEQTIVSGPAIGRDAIEDLIRLSLRRIQPLTGAVSVPGSHLHPTGAASARSQPAPTR